MEENNNISELKALIGTCQFNKVLKVLLDNEKRLSENLINELYLLKSEYQDIKQKQRLGLSITTERLNQFKWNLLQLVDEISKTAEIIVVNQIQPSPSKQIMSFGASLTVFGVTVLGITLFVQAGLTITSIISILITLAVIGIALIIYEKFN